MTKTSFYAVLAAVMLDLTGLRRAGAYPLTITLPPKAIPAPPPNSSIPPLLGSWHDGQCVLLPPGITSFEAVSDTITFRQDGTFTQDINKATGRLKESGTYTVAGSRLTLCYLAASTNATIYNFSHTGNTLLLQPIGTGKGKVLTLDRGRS